MHIDIANKSHHLWRMDKVTLRNPHHPRNRLKADTK